MEATRSAFRSTIVLTLAVALFTIAVVGPASATQRKKAKSRVTFEASGAFLTGDPVDGYVLGLPAGRTGVTANDFALTCAIPTSQGFDAYVVELPDEITTGTSEVRLETDELVSPYDNAYMTSYDSNCERTGYLGKSASLDPGTKYILVTGWVEAGASFHLSVVESR
jgi:hypothetical protein